MFDKKEYRRAYYIKNRDRLRKKSKEWYDNNIEHARKRNSIWQKNNLKRRREYMKERRKTHGESIKTKWRAWRVKNAKRVNFNKRKNRYGITQDQCVTLFKQQKGKCAICCENLTMSFHVDHDHQADYVRGLLCRGCNHGLGCFRDNVKYLHSAATYLEESLPFIKSQARKLQRAD